MINLSTDIQSLSHFKRNSPKVMAGLKKTGRPLVLTVNGKAEAVVQDAASYQRLLDIAAKGDAREGIRQGREQLDRGDSQDLDEFLAEFEAEHGIPR